MRFSIFKCVKNAKSKLYFNNTDVIINLDFSVISTIGKFCF